MVSISPLSQEETAQLLSSLLEQILLPAELQTQVLSRAEGNPLFIEETARMLLEADGQRIDDDRIPDSVQALIAGPLKSPVTRPGFRLPMRSTKAT